MAVGPEGQDRRLDWGDQDLPDPSQNVLAAGDVIVLDRNGKLIEDWSPAGHYHVTMTLQQMGPYAPKAVLAAEDRNFYNHGAVDPASIARAAWVDVTSRGVNQGGSTITQQLVKIQLLTPERSISRKIQEVVLAIVLEQRYSKDQILGMYLNRVYFGHGAYGVGAAAKTYFNKDAKDLTPAQAAFLAGIIQAPSAYDPALHYDDAYDRMLYVLHGMVTTGALTQDEADKAANEDIKSELHIQSTARQSKAPHFVDYVLTRLENLFGSAAVQQGGIVVKTTLDLTIQQDAENAITNGTHDLSYLGVNNSSLLAANPKNGDILAWVDDLVDDPPRPPDQLQRLPAVGLRQRRHGRHPRAHGDPLLAQHPRGRGGPDGGDHQRDRPRPRDGHP